MEVPEEEEREGSREIIWKPETFLKLMKDINYKDL